VPPCLRERYSGLILLDKKPGVTSFEALGEVKRALGTGKVGHTGTLDKFASGLLVVLAGRALKLSKWFSHCDKQYTGTIRFGIETDTLDPEGKVIAEAEVPTREKVEQALSQFTGRLMQEPPAFSAIHINGRRASSLARSGKAPEMKKRPVSIYKLELLSWNPPLADIFVHCSSGTYIRSLARDIALAAGSRAHLCALRRTKVAGFFLGNGEWGMGNGAPGQAPRSGVDEQSLHGVAHSKSRQDEKMREGFSLSCAPGLGNGFDVSNLSCLPIRSDWEQQSLLPIDKQVINELGLPWFEVEPPEAEKIFHGKPLAPILENKELFSPRKDSQKDDDNFAAAVFAGQTLAAVVEKIGGVWKYGCVMRD